MLQSLLPELGSEQDDALPHVRRLVAAHSVGRQTGNPELCRWLFKCDKENRRLKEQGINGVMVIRFFCT